jgi:hypothetical protein
MQNLSLKEYYNNFEWVRGKTPFSSLEFPVIASIVYLLVIFGIKNYKTTRKASDVNQYIILHNAFLIVISAAIFFGTIYELINNFLVTYIFFRSFSPSRMAPLLLTFSVILIERLQKEDYGSGHTSTI